MGVRCPCTFEFRTRESIAQSPPSVLLHPERDVRALRIRFGATGSPVSHTPQEVCLREARGSLHSIRLGSARCTWTLMPSHP